MIHDLMRKRGKCLPVQPVICFAIEVLIANLAADSDLQIRFDRHQPRIKQLVEIRSQ